MEIFENAPERAYAWAQAGRGAALATVVETWGSAPRRVGAQLAIAADGEMQGSVSGGCVEGAVVVEALEAIEDGAPRLLEYGVSDGDAFAVGLACGGKIRVLVEPVGAKAMPFDVLGDLVRLVIVGAVHIAQALVPMAQVAGFDAVVIDPREAFGSQARFPDAQVINDWPDAAMITVGVDTRSAIVLLTHDPKLDDPALHIALRSDAFYIGALGSKRTHASRVARLEEAGFTAADIARINGPVGLDIGAASPPEIAVSILSQMIQALRKP